METNCVAGEGETAYLYGLVLVRKQLIIAVVFRRGEVKFRVSPEYQVAVFMRYVITHFSDQTMQ